MKGNQMDDHDNYVIVDVYPTWVPYKFVIQWEDENNPLFGSISIEVVHTGGVIIDSEYKNREFVKKILSKLVDMAEFEGEIDGNVRWEEGRLNE